VGGRAEGNFKDYLKLMAGVCEVPERSEEFKCSEA